jgi:glycerophosphoryl diester phosphodiesterase
VPMIDRKAGDAEQLVAELQRLDVVDDVIVQSSDWDWLVEVAAAEPRLLLAALGGDEPTPSRLGDIERTGARIVHWNHARVTPAMEDAVHASGRLLCVYTVDAEEAFNGAWAIGCDLITTNRPGYYVATVRQGQVLPQRR